MAAKNDVQEAERLLIEVIEGCGHEQMVNKFAALHHLGKTALPVIKKALLQVDRAKAAALRSLILHIEADESVNVEGQLHELRCSDTEDWETIEEIIMSLIGLGQLAIPAIEKELRGASPAMKLILNTHGPAGRHGA